MLKIKVTTSFPQWPLLRQTPESSGIWKNCKFYVNEDIDECDFWVVYGDLVKPESVNCAPENIIFITGEPSSVKVFNDRFLSQFSKIITSQRNIKHPEVIYSQEGLPWLVGRKVIDNVNLDFSKNYDELKKIDNYNKVDLLSVISSNKTITEGHRKRLEFVEKLKLHFGENISIFGSGIKEVEDKWDALYPYKYHIVIENSSYDDYWTEKLADAYLAGCYPFYYGCTNLNKYFPESSYTTINIEDAEEAIAIIEKEIFNNKYEASKEVLKECKSLILDKYNIFPMIYEICSNDDSKNNVKSKIKLMPELYFKRDIKSIIKVIYKSLTKHY